jgi:hypothetical protein
MGGGGGGGAAAAMQQQGQHQRPASSSGAWTADGPVGNFLALFYLLINPATAECVC